jgi:AcrR family transcriptional regulator
MALKRTTTKEDRRLQILQGALEVFSTRGFAETSIKDIAVAAGINSAALIYHYFRNKEDLLRAVIEQYAPPLQLMARPEAMAALPVRDALLKFANVYLTIMDDTQIAACIRVMVSEAIRSPEFAAVLGEAAPQRIWAVLATYLKGQMDAGKLRSTDPQLAARCFLSPLFNHVFVRTIARLHDPLEIDPGEFAAFCVDMFLNGCAAPGICTENEAHA